MRGFSDAYGSWNTICIRRRSARSSRAPTPESTSMPSNSHRARRRLSSRITRRPVVDLPQPDSPTRPSVVPRRMREADAGDGVHRGDLAAEQPGADREVLDQVCDLRAAARRRSPACVRGRLGRAHDASVLRRVIAAASASMPRSRRLGGTPPSAPVPTSLQLGADLRCTGPGSRRTGSADGTRSRRAARSATAAGRRCGAAGPRSARSSRGNEASSPCVYGCFGS